MLNGIVSLVDIADSYVIVTEQHGNMFYIDTGCSEISFEAWTLISFDLGPNGTVLNAKIL